MSAPEQTAALLAVEGLRKEYPVRRGLLRRRLGAVHALAGVDLRLRRGECLALVGESGSGKTTLGRCALRLIEPTAGRVSFDGEDLLALEGGALRARRRRFQMVFQDPYGSLDPRQRVGSIVAEPLAIHTALDRAGRAERAAELLAAVGLAPAFATRFPHELSGGQRQRVGIARALAPAPDLLVADEPVSSLDVSVRGQILDLLSGLRERLGLSDAADRARHGGGRAAGGPGGGDVSRADRGAGPGARAAGAAAPSVYGEPAVGGAGGGAPRATAARRAAGGAAEPARAPAPAARSIRAARAPGRAARPSGRRWRPPGGAEGTGGEWGRAVACFYPGELPMPGSKQDTVAS